MIFSTITTAGAHLSLSSYGIATLARNRLINQSVVVIVTWLVGTQAKRRGDNEALAAVPEAEEQEDGLHGTPSS
jgi:hypothetical protein